MSESPAPCSSPTLSPRVTNIVLVVALVGVGAYAVLRPSSVVPPKVETASAETPAPSPGRDPSMPPLPGQAGMGTLPPVSETQALPPGHPNIGGGSGSNMNAGAGAGAMANGLPPNDDAPSVTWKAPAGWKTVPNPSSMRIATYRVPRAAGITDDADLAVTRAGGSTDANIERWVGQFDVHGKETRTEKTVHGLKITVVEMSGTFGGGGGAMMQGASTPKPGWSLLAAIVEAPGTPYFFKLTGPSASIAAARTSFAALLDTVSPT